MVMPREGPSREPHPVARYAPGAERPFRIEFEPAGHLRDHFAIRRILVSCLNDKSQPVLEELMYPDR